MTKADIIQAAFKVWGRDFYLNTSLSHVARELKVCKPALYRHFKSKSDLFEAMTQYFIDDFAEFIRADYEQAIKTEDGIERAIILTRIITEYFARNVYFFIFSMVKLRDHQLEGPKLLNELLVRGIDLINFHKSRSLLMQLIYATLIFFTAGFHKQRKSLTNPPGEAEISQIIGMIGKIIKHGLCYTKEEIDPLDYNELENRIAGTINNIEDDPLLKAVAAAVASAGPWEASMEQVAHRSGLAKSSLYGHFKNKQDMLHQLFLTETVRIIEFARQGIRQSAIPQEQLYLGIYSITEYLLVKPDIVRTMDWLRTRRPTIEPRKKAPPSNKFLRIFEDIDITMPQESPSVEGAPSTEGEELWLSPWILFLIINTLMHRRIEQPEANDIRSLHQFLTLGIGGFTI